MTGKVKIRLLLEKDGDKIVGAFEQQGWNQKLSLYEKYFEEQAQGIRDVLVAEYDGDFAGYLTIVWKSHYPPFGEKGIPEIVDFNVLESCQKRGVGTKLLNAAEQSISSRADHAGIGVGLFSDYGNAQKLYVKNGYIPDGRGIYKEGDFPQFGDIVTIDDGLALYLTKRLK